MKNINIEVGRCELLVMLKKQLLKTTITANFISLDYHLVNVPEFVTKPMGLKFQHGSRFVEPFNVIIAERSSYIKKQLDDHDSLLSKKCSDHLFPDASNVGTHFIPLSLNLMSSTSIGAHKF